MKCSHCGQELPPVDTLDLAERMARVTTPAGRKLSGVKLSIYKLMIKYNWAEVNHEALAEELGIDNRLLQVFIAQFRKNCEKQGVGIVVRNKAIRFLILDENNE